jgi:hypothetical protein
MPVVLHDYEFRATRVLLVTPLPRPARWPRPAGGPNPACRPKTARSAQLRDERNWVKRDLRKGGHRSPGRGRPNRLPYGLPCGLPLAPRRKRLAYAPRWCIGANGLAYALRLARPRKRAPLRPSAQTQCRLLPRRPPLTSRGLARPKSARSLNSAQGKAWANRQALANGHPPPAGRTRHHSRVEMPSSSTCHANMDSSRKTRLCRGHAAFARDFQIRARQVQRNRTNCT